MKRNHWYSIKNQSLAAYARNAGFDLSIYKEYSQSVQYELRKRTIKEALWQIEDACDDEGFDVCSVKDGIYVISLSNPLSIKYQKKRSQVIYIGRGNIINRIEQHLNNSLFDFMLSLSGANFDFSFSRPSLKGTSSYYKHVEYLMLEYFSAKYSGLDGKKRFPILNSITGSDKKYKAGGYWWKKPLQSSGKRPLWELCPTSFSDFAPLDEE